MKIHVTGIVQGVGFRPFVYRQAKLHLINGWVYNSADGVHIHAEGEDKLVDEFCLALSNEAPAASRVEQIEMQEVPLEGYKSFEIKHSEDVKTSKAGSSAGETLISPDIATCKDCVKELFDKKDRRYRYPFINCTNCGPRFTIIDKLPYDRCYTTMRTFKMCDVCSDEYHNPADRRFHAQPDACFDCGPQISWLEAKKVKRSQRVGSQGAGADPLGSLFFASNRDQSDEIFSKCVKFLKDGKIVAIKGLGGFHLACDATNEKAVARLRSKKMRSNKAFAIMAPNLKSVKEICNVSKAEQDILEGSVRPIVLLKSKDAGILADNVAMGLPEVGVMLPYTPVQHILMHDFAKAGGKFLVMTSGNIYDNPIVTDDEIAFEVLGDVADAFLGNNREILARYDDSVVRVIDAGGTDAIQMIRRARGYSPSPIKIKLEEYVSAFACGPEQKNTFAFSREIPEADENSQFNTEVFVSQHIGDVENAEVMDAWTSSKKQYEKNFKFKPKKFYCDMHPEYLTTKWALNLGTEVPSSWPFGDMGTEVSDSKGFRNNGKPQLEDTSVPISPKGQLEGTSVPKVRKVQHHYAHIRSVMYENGMQGPVIGFAFDGTGYGMDKNIWGGECLICNTHDFERFANFTYVPMPGGKSAIKDPLKMAFGVLWSLDLLDEKSAKAILDKFSKKDLQNLNSMVEQGLNSPMTSSVGRLFDAASALLGICEHPSYEGEAAIMLEAKLWEYLSANKKKAFDKRYEIAFTKNVGSKDSTAHDTSVVLMDPRNTFKALLEDANKGIDAGQIAKNFHDAFANAILQCAQLANQLYGIKQVALSGGVFMNRYLIETSIKKLIDAGFSVALNREVPPNDGGISLGQI